MYSPLIGQFAQRDPLGYAAGDANLLRYCGNRATKANDPLGLASNGASAGEVLQAHLRDILDEGKLRDYLSKMYELVDQAYGKMDALKDTNLQKALRGQKPSVILDELTRWAMETTDPQLSAARTAYVGMLAEQLSQGAERFPTTAQYSEDMAKLLSELDVRHMKDIEEAIRKAAGNPEERLTLPGAQNASKASDGWKLAPKLDYKEENGRYCGTLELSVDFQKTHGTVSEGLGEVVFKSQATVRISIDTDKRFNDVHFGVSTPLRNSITAVRSFSVGGGVRTTSEVIWEYDPANNKTPQTANISAGFLFGDGPLVVETLGILDLLNPKRGTSSLQIGIHYRIGSSAKKNDPSLWQRYFPSTITLDLKASVGGNGNHGVTIGETITR